ncbi:MAG TPA: SDR family oxidoreductase [Umezawaea sp.]|nr:SDR family oxidoreductase [Umezawaea sp.]
MGTLEGKAVVVTGAGRGLGRAYALHAAGAGASVVVNDVDGESAEKVVSEIRETGGRAVPNGDSVADADLAAALVARCVAEFGAIDGLVNNAGLTDFADPWTEDPDRMRAVIEVNVLGTMFCGSAAVKAMHARGSGVIVNVASGAMLGRADATAYSASKGAVAAMTSAWAAGLAGHGVRVNAICPLAWTPMMDSDPRANGISDPTQTPERMAPLVTYLLSDLSAGITGQLVRLVDGKLMLVRQMAVKEPVLVRDAWSVEEIARAFDDGLREVAEPPGRDRWRL